MSTNPASEPPAWRHTPALVPVESAEHAHEYRYLRSVEPMRDDAPDRWQDLFYCVFCLAQERVPVDG